MKIAESCWMSWEQGLSFPQFSNKHELYLKQKSACDLQKKGKTDASGQSSSSITHDKPTEDFKSKYISIRSILEKRIWPKSKESMPYLQPRIIKKKEY